MENVFQFVLDLFLGNGIVIAVGCFVIADIIKKSVKLIANRYIPLIAGTLGGILAVLIPGIYPEHDVVSSIICGITLGWAATGGYETVKCLLNKEKCGDDINAT